jgi:exodeoxyribonuclease-3
VILNVLSYNIRYGGIGRENEIAAVIQKAAPDLVVFQEAIRPRVIESLALHTGMKCWGARPGRSLAFMSRIEIAHHAWRRPWGSRHYFLEIAPAGSKLRMFGLHLRAIHSNWTERLRLRELEAMLKAIREQQNGLHALLGDFNTLAPGELLHLDKLPFRLQALVRLTGREIRWRTIKTLLEAGYVDGFRMLHPDDPGFTFPTWSPHLRLDFVFVPGRFSAHLERCEVANVIPGAGKASDHFPLLSQFHI